MITDINQLDLSKQYTYADYLTWWFEDRVELIKGHIRKMAPAPSDGHQKYSFNIVFALGNLLKNKKCEVRYAPYDVRLKRTVDDTEVTTVVQPDICVICNPDLIDKRGCNGAPDLIIEILSESNRKHDIVTKYHLYEEAGVKEYWIVYPSSEMIEVYYLENNKYRLAKKYLEDDLLPVQTLEGLVIDLKEIF
jgi:Uma2 family endonuclease